MSDLSLQISASAVAADQAQLDTAANNLANISTPGYAQQVVNLSDFSPSTAQGVGEGVQIVSVTQNTSTLDEQQNLIAQGQLGAANESSQIMGLVQNSFPEPSSNGLQSQLSTLWSDLSTLAAQPNSQAAQQQVVQDASSVASTMNSTYTQLSSISQQLVTNLGGAGSSNGGYVQQANQLLSEIANLNGSIIAAQNGGQNVNALSDQMRSDVTSLGTLLGVRTITQANGSVTVLSGGIQLVSGTHAVTLNTTGQPATSNLAVETAAGNVLPAGGQIGALLQAANTTIPSYLSQLSSVANSLATNLNTLQSQGVSASGVPGPASASAAPPYAGATLPSIFVDNASATTYTAGTTAASTITINPQLLANPTLIATASGTSTAGVATIDPTTAQAMANVGQLATGPNSIYQSLVANVGNDTAQANNAQSTTQAMASSTSAQLLSVEGVSTNEQTVNMLSAQQAYQASAAVINSTTTALNALLAAV